MPATAYREEQWGDLADALLARPAQPLVLVGFSYGADDVILIARRLAEHGRPVDLLVTIDPVTPAAACTIGRTNQGAVMTRPIRLLTSILLTACLAAAPATRPTMFAPRLNAPRLPSNVVADLDVRYGDAADTANRLDVYRRRDAPAGPLPAVLWVHGGAWFLGDKWPCRALPLIDHGFVVVSVNYRLTSAAPFPAQIQDCKGAVRFVRAHAAEYHIDPNRIGAWGESAGGHLVALLGTSGGNADLEGTVGGNLDQSSRVQAVCDWYGPTDLTQFTAQATANGHPPGRFDAYIIRALFGGDPLQHLDLVAEANPLHYLPAGPATEVPPFLIMHGDRDRTVPVGQSRILADALKTGGVPTTFRVVVGLGHGFPAGRSDVGPVTLDFFQRTLHPPATTRP